MAHVIVLHGGTSNERAVSLRSGKAVAKALKQVGHRVELIDPAIDTPDYIEKLRQADVVFPVLHGLGGEDGSLQALLETEQLAFVGSGSLASALCFNKASYQKRLEDAAILMPASEVVDAQTFALSELISKPYVLKPIDGGSSIDAHIIKDITTADHAKLQRSLKKYRQMLLQELIEGIEITVGVLQNRALPVIEIIPPEHELFDYKHKYDGSTQELCPPLHLSKEVQERAQALALEIHQLTDCRHHTRTDMIVTKDGALYVLETNTSPGMTDQSLQPKAAAEVGHSMADYCDHLVQLAMSGN